jgi:hypothetical protein
LAEHGPIPGRQADRLRVQSSRNLIQLSHYSRPAFRPIPGDSLHGAPHLVLRSRTPSAALAPHLLEAFARSGRTTAARLVSFEAGIPALTTIEANRSILWAVARIVIGA